MRETEGEVIVLALGGVTPAIVRSFLDSRHIESVKSRILALAQEILRRYPTLPADAVEALLAENESEYGPCIDSVDAHLLEVMAEDLGPQDTDDRFEALVGSLFATHQAARVQTLPDLPRAVNWLMHSRRRSILSRVPDGARRQRFARAGLSVSSCLVIEEAIGELRDALNQSHVITEASLQTVISITCRAKELAGQDPVRLSRIAFQWVNLASYDALVRYANDDDLSTLEEIVDYVENVISYRTPWVLDGMVCTLESQPGDDEAKAAIPRWFTLLGSFLRYGVNTEELVWVMSMGITDRRVAQWILARYAADHQSRPPRRFRGLVRWAIQTRAETMEALREEWPEYFARMYAKVLDRYQQILSLLPGEPRA